MKVFVEKGFGNSNPLAKACFHAPKRLKKLLINRVIFDQPSIPVL